MRTEICESIAMEILTTDELADLLRISRNKVILMAQRGELPTLRIMGKLRFDADEVENWLKLHRQKSEGGTPKAIIEWADGLSARPIICPLGNSFEETEQIRTLLERLFRERGK